ncbi:MAG: HAD family phosphatase [Lentisphaerae bacterium]|jgi:beta-phosphoglucomutase-like phosphatase (HAD superfamily)|nr:HAD family phosphatase [Lentisphaerota bacterium]MBT4815623.1 HAD family phosphatase [Lentisphaerota bacterium]MBT5607454.1 HAD family phosphatase [Lentisphaerota bacterium]MBT7055734.1 HAD family phosphatase [Lentisphaerota bacterium]MBT7843131.1 HAD family phosphatase [Lentisphaerota bacterium]
MIQAVIFDLDGTLMDSEILWVQALQRAYAEKGCRIPDDEARKLVYGKAWSDIYKNVDERYPGHYPTIKLAEPVTERHFLALKAATDIRIHSSIALLRRLAGEFPLAIVSGSTRGTIRTSIVEMGVEDEVCLFLGTEDYSPGKPDPAGFVMAARKLAVPTTECLVFEDSEAGVRAAKACGMFCVALQQPGRPPQDLSPADLILPDLAQFNLDALDT